MQGLDRRHPTGVLQQAPVAEGRAGAEALAPSTDRREREDGQMAVHTAVRGTHFGNQETQSRGDFISYSCVVESPLLLPFFLSVSVFFLVDLVNITNCSIISQSLPHTRTHTHTSTPTTTTLSSLFGLPFHDSLLSPQLCTLKKEWRVVPSRRLEDLPEDSEEIKKIKKVQSFFRGWLCRRRWKQIVEEYIRSPHAESMRKRNR